MKIQGNAIERAGKIKLVIFDVDGVLTDGGVYVGEHGELYKPFYCRDGLAIALLRRVGIKTAVITGRTSKMVAFRAAELKIDAVWQGHLDKREAYAALKQQFGITDDEVAYIGDDLVDLPVMLQAGLAAAVGDAVPEVKKISHVIADARGGYGAVRELLEFILKAQGLWEGIVDGFMHPESLTGLAQ